MVLKEMMLQIFKKTLINKHLNIYGLKILQRKSILLNNIHNNLQFNYLRLYKVKLISLNFHPKLSDDQKITRIYRKLHMTKTIINNLKFNKN